MSDAHHFDGRAKCRVRSLRYDFDRRTGRLNLPPKTKADMHGVIDIFDEIDPGVREIIVVTPGEVGVVYVNDPKFGWTAVELVE